jgi:CheY-like chemotaxis protein
VQTAEDGPSALRLLRNGLHADLVLSDIMMPGGMNGAELAVTIREEFPTVFVLLTTGYAAAAASALAQQFPVIRKPFRRAELMDTVGKILGG